MCITEYNEKTFVDGIKAEAIGEGEDKLGKLINLLMKSNRSEDVTKAATDKEARKKLYKEFGMID